MNYRLVVQLIPRSWGSEGLEWTERCYILQAQESFVSTDGRHVVGAWGTIPPVDFNDLTEKEQAEIYTASGLTKDEHGYWIPK